MGSLARHVGSRLHFADQADRLSGTQRDVNRFGCVRHAGFSMRKNRATRHMHIALGDTQVPGPEFALVERCQCSLTTCLHVGHHLYRHGVLNGRRNHKASNSWCVVGDAEENNQRLLRRQRS